MSLQAPELCALRKKGTARSSGPLSVFLQAIARAMYSNPPVHGALLVDNILGTPEIKQQWFDEVKGMADRIIDMRTLLQTNLEKSGSSLPWKHVTEQIGMFCFSGISPEQVSK